VDVVAGIIAKNAEMPKVKNLNTNEPYIGRWPALSNEKGSLGLLAI